MVRVADGGAAIELEVWSLPNWTFGTFVRQIPAPLGIGTIELADGSNVLGFLCEAHATQEARDITSLGGWRAYMKTLN
jgi:allophanate hydrolase